MKDEGLTILCRQHIKLMAYMKYILLDRGPINILPEEIPTLEEIYQKYDFLTDEGPFGIVLRVAPRSEREHEQ